MSVVFPGVSKFAARLFDNDLQIILILTGSATRKPRLAGGDKGRNKKQTVSLPGRSALWAGSFT
jgi:hypothetical protein